MAPQANSRMRRSRVGSCERYIGWLYGCADGEMAFGIRTFLELKNENGEAMGAVASHSMMSFAQRLAQTLCQASYSGSGKVYSWMPSRVWAGVTGSKEAELPTKSQVQSDLSDLEGVDWLHLYHFSPLVSPLPCPSDYLQDLLQQNSFFLLSRRAWCQLESLLHLSAVVAFCLPLKRSRPRPNAERNLPPTAKSRSLEAPRHRQVTSDETMSAWNLTKSEFSVS